MNFLFILASLISIPAFGGEFPNSPANNFSAVEEERIRVRGVLEDLEKKLSADPGNRALIQELKKASEHQAMLAAELVKLHQSKISITQNSTKKTEDSEELQINVLRVEATLKFLDQLVEESGAKLNLKISKAPFEYDNRHFLFVRKKRKFNKDSSKIAVQILDQQRKSIREFQIRASERIHTLQARSQSAHLETLESLQLNLKEMELLRQQIVQTTYNMEAEMNQILENIKFLQKLNPKLTKYYSKILNASYVPHGLNAVESEEYTASKEEALHQVKEILSQARNSELILKLIPSELETNLLSKLDQVIDTYNERAALYISEKGGVYGFLSNYRSSVNREINLTILWAAIHASFITNASIDFMSQFEVDSLNEKLATKLRSEIKKLKKDLIQGAEQEIKQGKAVLKDISSRHGQILKDSYSNLLFKVSKDFVHHWMSSSRTNFQRMQQKNLKSQNDETKSLLKEADRIYKTIEFSLKNDQTLEVLKNSFSQYTTDILKLKAALEKLINKELAAESQSQNRFNLEFKTHSDNFNRLSQKLAESQEITQHIISLSLSLNETGFQYIRYLNRKKDTLASEIKGIKNSLNFKLFSKSANIQYRLDSLKEGVADLTKTINQFSAIFGGLLEIKKTLDWAENFGKHLSDLTQILLGEKNEFVHWDDAVNVGKTELHNIAEGFAHFMRHEHQFNFLKFKFELDEGSKKIHDKIEEILGDTATLLIGLHFSYDQIYLNSNLWDIQDPATVGVKTLRLTRDLKNRPSGIPSEIVSAWRSFAGYISLALSTANPSNILPDELAQLFNSLDSKTNLSEIQADDHYLPPFAGANSESLPGLENFGNTCYLNAILKAVTTTSLQKVFSPTFKLVQRKDQTDPTQNESDEAFQMRLESQKTIALFLSTLGTQESAQWISSKFTKELSST
ncbi:MAG: hypothetical protein ABI041_01460, partial [Bdellovibrionia bacterium]